MTLIKKESLNSIKEAKIHKKDTGSAPVQMTQLTIKINHLSKHLQKNPKDIVTRRALLKKVAIRKRWEKYVTKNKSSVKPKIKK